MGLSTQVQVDCNNTRTTPKIINVPHEHSIRNDQATYVEYSLCKHGLQLQILCREVI